MRQLQREDVERLWFQTFGRDDWSHIVDFANAVVGLRMATADDPAIARIADAIQERGRKSASGEPLFFDRCNLEAMILAGLAGSPSAGEPPR